MSARQLLRLAGILGAVLLLWGVAALVRRDSNEGAGGTRPLAIDSAKVDSVLFGSAADTVKLVKTSGAWRVNGFSAAPDEVSVLLGALADTTQAELVAESPGSHARLGVDSTKGRRVRVMSGGKPVLNVLVGSSETGAGSGYLRRHDQAAVYRVRGRLAELAGRSADEWRDKTIVSLSADSIGAIEVRRGTIQYVLRRDGKSWRLTPGKAADSTRAGSLVRDVAQIRAAGFATPAQSASLKFTRPDRRLTIKTAGGRNLAALVFDSTSSGIWVRYDTAGRGTIWRIESWDWDRIMPERKSMEAGAR